MGKDIKDKKNNVATGITSNTKPEPLTPAASGLSAVFEWLSSTLMTIYILFMLVVFPLYTHNKYFDILKARFEFFWIGTLILLCAFLLMGIFYLISDQVSTHGELRKRFLSHMKFSEIKKRLISTDIAFFALWILTAISTALSEYPYESFWGNRGRYEGLLLWTMFFAAYFLITRFYRFEKWHMIAFLISGSAVCIWGITDFFGMDIFGFLDGVDDQFRYTFYSSIGNINTYTNFTAMMLGFVTVLFIYEEKTVSTIAYFIFMTIAAFAGISGNSDNVILSAGALYAVLPFVCFKSFKGIYRYVISLATFATCMCIAGISAYSGDDAIREYTAGALTSIGNTTAMQISTMILWMVSITIYVIFRKQIKNTAYKTYIEYFRNNDIDSSLSESSKKYRDAFKKVRIVWLAFCIVVIVTIVLVFVDANTGGHLDVYSKYSYALIFNDAWGGGRGLIWKLAFSIFSSGMTKLQQLFGYGPDTFYIITMENFQNVMLEAGYGAFDAAHNEYIDYLMTIGVAGMLAYISVIICSIKQTVFGHESVIMQGINCMTSGKIDTSYITACGMAVLCYAIQAIINIAIPITTPVLIILLAIGSRLIILRDNKRVL